MRDATAHNATICPDSRRHSGDIGALDQAFQRIREQYIACLEGFRASGRDPVVHLKLTIDRPPEKPRARLDQSA